MGSSKKGRLNILVLADQLLGHLRIHARRAPRRHAVVLPIDGSLVLHGALPGLVLGRETHRADSCGRAAASEVLPPDVLHLERLLRVDVGRLHALHAQRRGELQPPPLLLQAGLGHVHSERMLFQHDPAVNLEGLPVQGVAAACARYRYYFATRLASR